MSSLHEIHPYLLSKHMQDIFLFVYSVFLISLKSETTGPNINATIGRCHFKRFDK